MEDYKQIAHGIVHDALVNAGVTGDISQRDRRELMESAEDIAIKCLELAEDQRVGPPLMGD
jgi:hypothetical protein